MAVAAAEAVCHTMCPDRRDTVVTGAPCRGKHGPCAKPPDGAPHFCDYQFGADAGVLCRLPRDDNGAVQFSTEDAMETCNSDNYPEYWGKAACADYNGTQS